MKTSVTIDSEGKKTGNKGNSRMIASNYASDAYRQNTMRKVAIDIGTRHLDQPEIATLVRQMKGLVNAFESNYHQFDRFLRRKPFTPPYPGLGLLIP